VFNTPGSSENRLTGAVGIPVIFHSFQHAYSVGRKDIPMSNNQNTFATINSIGRIYCDVNGPSKDQITKAAHQYEMVEVILLDDGKHPGGWELDPNAEDGSGVSGICGEAYLAEILEAGNEFTKNGTEDETFYVVFRTPYYTVYFYNETKPLKNHEGQTLEHGLRAIAFVNEKAADGDETYEGDVRIPGKFESWLRDVLNDVGQIDPLSQQAIVSGRVNTVQEGPGRTTRPVMWDYRDLKALDPENMPTRILFDAGSLFLDQEYYKDFLCGALGSEQRHAEPYEGIKDVYLEFGLEGFRILSYTSQDVAGEENEGWAIEQLLIDGDLVLHPCYAVDEQEEPAETSKARAKYWYQTVIDRAMLRHFVTWG